MCTAGWSFPGQETQEKPLFSNLSGALVPWTPKPFRPGASRLSGAHAGTELLSHPRPPLIAWGDASVRQEVRNSTVEMRWPSEEHDRKWAPLYQGIRDARLTIGSVVDLEGASRGVVRPHSRLQRRRVSRAAGCARILAYVGTEYVLSKNVRIDRNQDAGIAALSGLYLSYRR